MNSSSSAVLTEVGKLLAMFPVSGMSEDMQRLRVAGYMEVLSGFPLDAVHYVCAKVRLGEYDQLNRAFAPTAAELAELVREQVARQGKSNRRPIFRRISATSPVIEIIPPPRSLGELSLLPPGSSVSYEEAMIITGGRPPVGRFDDPAKAKMRSVPNGLSMPGEGRHAQALREASAPPAEDAA